jgi:AcrR family transcriptional regulator
MHVYNWHEVAERLNKHQQKTEATRKKLLAAALRVFSRDGFERSRLEDIAAEAGHTRGAFYANFASKEDLFIALLESQAAKRFALMSKAFQDNTRDEDWHQTIRDFYVNRAKDRQWYMLMLEFKLYALRHSEHRARFAAAHRRIRESFHLQVMTSLKAISPAGSKSEQHAKIILEVVASGLILEHAYDPKRISAEEVTHLLGKMFDMLTCS